MSMRNETIVCKRCGGVHSYRRALPSRIRWYCPECAAVVDAENHKKACRTHYLTKRKPLRDAQRAIRSDTP